MISWHTTNISFGSFLSVEEKKKEGLELDTNTAAMSPVCGHLLTWPHEVTGNE